MTCKKCVCICVINILHFTTRGRQVHYIKIIKKRMSLLIEISLSCLVIHISIFFFFFFDDLVTEKYFYSHIIPFHSQKKKNKTGETMYPDNNLNTCQYFVTDDTILLRYNSLMQFHVKICISIFCFE